MEPKPLVYVVDDEPRVREALAATREWTDLEVICFGSAAEFLEHFNPDRLGCLVVDLRIQGAAGQNLLEVLREQGVNLPAIVVSGRADVSAAVRAMKAGAIDFLEKPYSIDALRHSVERAVAVCRRQRSEHALAAMLQARYDRLSLEERQIAELTVQGELDKQIASRLDISKRTIQARRASAMRKMQARTRPELIQMIHSIGLIPERSGRS